MKSKGIVRQEKTILFEQSDDESAFSAESTDQESSDAKVRRKKRQRGSSESDDEVTGKSCLEALILTLVNPHKTSDRSLNSLKNTSSQHFVYKNCFLF